MHISPEIEPTDDGSNTLVHPLLGETYHSTRGAVGEAMHVYIANGLRMSPLRSLRILEVGFGSGLNAWLTLQECVATDRTVEYHALELYPIDNNAVARLNYTADPLFWSLHSAPWNEICTITDNFRLKKVEGDLVDIEFDAIFDLVYFDAFAPQSQPELWSERVFTKIYERMSAGGALVTYCSKGDVKRALRAVGFEVRRMEGALGKRHMIRAIKM